MILLMSIRFCKKLWLVKSQARSLGLNLIRHICLIVTLLAMKIEMCILLNLYGLLTQNRYLCFS